MRKIILFAIVLTLIIIFLNKREVFNCSTSDGLKDMRSLKGYKNYEDDDSFREVIIERDESSD